MVGMGGLIVLPPVCGSIVLTALELSVADGRWVGRTGSVSPSDKQKDGKMKCK